jgi:hypothetical protein
VESGRTYRGAMAAVFGADLLLLVPGRTRNRRYMITTKLYDYLAAGKPILAVTDESAAGAFLEQHPEFAEVASPDDSDAVADALESLYQAVRRSSIRPIPADVLTPYHRRETVHLLARTLDAMTEDGV